MKLIESLDPRRLLGLPAIYNLHSRFAAADARKQTFVDRFLQPQSGERVLDIGCGTAPLLGYMPEVEYVGFDLSSDYIEQAKQMHGDKGQFFHHELTLEVAQGQKPFDLVMATGVVHHLDDEEAGTLFKVAHAALKPGGRLVTCDGAFEKGQNPIARILLKLDRGEYIRGLDAYRTIARQTFADVSASVHHDLNAYPYTHCVMKCTRAP